MTKRVEVVWIDPQKNIGSDVTKDCELTIHKTIGYLGRAMTIKQGRKLVKCIRLVNDISTDRRDDFIDIPTTLIIAMRELKEVVDER